MGIKFVNVAEQAGIKHKTIYGDEHKNRYLLETTGCGVAFIDFDNDGWQDVFLVNGTRLGEGSRRNKAFIRTHRSATTSQNLAPNFKASRKLGKLGVGKGGSPPLPWLRSPGAGVNRPS